MSAELDRLEMMERFLEQEGYRRCDIPACNCNRWHGGHSNQRLAEMVEKVDAMQRDIDRLRAEFSAERERNARIREAFNAATDTKFFHDGLSADLHSCRDKAHAYIEGWEGALEVLRPAIAASEKHWG